jgi:hypothetical protein
VQHLTKVIETVACRTPAERAVLLDICYAADRKGVVRLGLGELAERASSSRRTIHTIINSFLDSGLLERQHRGRYVLNLEALEDIDRWLPQSPQVIKDEQGVIRTQAEADTELERLRTVRRDSQGFYYTVDGWPVLRPRD